MGQIKLLVLLVTVSPIISVATTTYNASDDNMVIIQEIKAKAPTSQIEDQPPLKVYNASEDCRDNSCTATENGPSH